MERSIRDKLEKVLLRGMGLEYSFGKMGASTRGCGAKERPTEEEG